MEVEAFIGDHDRLWIVHRPLHLLLGIASWVGAPVVAPGHHEKKKREIMTMVQNFGDIDGIFAMLGCALACCCMKLHQADKMAACGKRSQSGGLKQVLMNFYFILIYVCHISKQVRCEHAALNSARRFARKDPKIEQSMPFEWKLEGMYSEWAGVQFLGQVGVGYL